MLPLHTTFRHVLFTSSSLFVILSSCADKSKTDLAVIKALGESIEYSNQSIDRNNEDVLISLKDKVSDPSTSERAMVWYPKAERIQKLSNEAYDYIEKVKNDLNEETIGKIIMRNGNGLFEKLISYKNEILQVDSGITYEFRKSLKLFTRLIDSSNVDQKESLRRYFNGTSVFAAKAILTKFQNNIRINEEKILLFCHEKTAIIKFGPDEFISFLVILSSSVVQPEEKIEITAGVGAFYTNSKPEVFIYNKLKKVGDDGAVHYKIKAASKPGKYYVPVKINFIDQNGKLQTIQKEMEYIVANIQKQ